MIKIEIPLEPVPWAAHRGFGKRSFNPRFKEKEAFQWYIKKQYDASPIEEAVSVRYEYQMPIPKSFSKKKRKDIENGIIRHVVKSDLDNLNKFTSDCLKGLVINDDNQIWECYSWKHYSDSPKVIITIYPESYRGLKCL